jgi:hypothetical protein
MLQYLHPDMMFHIDKLIKAINGVIDIMPDKNVLITGKYRVPSIGRQIQNRKRPTHTFSPSMVRRTHPCRRVPKPKPIPRNAKSPTYS